MKKRALVLIVLIGALPSIVFAKSENLSLGLTIQYPNKWISDSFAEETKMYSPDGRAIVVCIVFKAQNLDEARAKVGNKLTRIIHEPSFTREPQDSFFNKLTGMMSEGTGSVQGDSVKWMLGLVLYKEKALLAVGYTKPDDYFYYKSTLNKIIHSVAPRVEKNADMSNV